MANIRIPVTEGYVPVLVFERLEDMLAELSIETRLNSVVLVRTPLSAPATIGQVLITAWSNDTIYLWSFMISTDQDSGRYSRSVVMVAIADIADQLLLILEGRDYSVRKNAMYAVPVSAVGAEGKTALVDTYFILEKCRDWEQAVKEQPVSLEKQEILTGDEN